MPVLAAVIECADQGGRLLLARNAAWSGRMFALITGFMEAGETPEEGIRREVAEETSLVVERTELLGVWDFQRMNQLIVAYHVVARGEVRLSPELAEYRLFDVADGEVLAGRHRLRAGEIREVARVRAPFHRTARSLESARPCKPTRNSTRAACCARCPSSRPRRRWPTWPAASCCRW